MNIEKAIERCNQLIKVEHANWIGISNQIAIGTVLDELDSKQDDINILETQRDSIENQFEQAKAIVEKQKKIINEMAKYINKLDIDEDICTKNVTNPEYCNEYYTNCKKCIKEYFTKKVEDK